MTRFSPSPEEHARKLRVAELDQAMTKFMADQEEREISIWMAVLLRRMTRLSEYLLEDDGEVETASPGQAEETPADDEAQKAVLARLEATDIDAMTEAEYDEWINNLPRAEFVALMCMCIADDKQASE